MPELGGSHRLDDLENFSNNFLNLENIIWTGFPYLVHGGHVGTPLMAALHPNTRCPPIAPCVQAAHPTKHLHENSFQAKHEFDQNRVKTGPKSATGEPPILSPLSSLQPDSRCTGLTRSCELEPSDHRQKSSRHTENHTNRKS